MKKTEKILLFLIGFILLIKFFRIPFSGPLIVVFLPTLGMAYLFGAWKLFETEGANKNYLISTVTGFIYYVISIGILFKLQLWPWCQNMIVIASAAGIIGMAFLFYKYKRARETYSIDFNYFSNMLRRSFFIVGTCVFLALVSVEFYVTLGHKNDPEYVRLFMRAYDADNNNQKYWDEFNSYANHRR